MKQEINQEELKKWRREKWVEYASVRVALERLVWAINLNGAYLVTHGDKELYRGFSFGPAKAAWDGA